MKIYLIVMVCICFFSMLIRGINVAFGDHPRTIEFERWHDFFSFLLFGSLGAWGVYLVVKL